MASKSRRLWRACVMEGLKFALTNAISRMDAAYWKFFLSKSLKVIMIYGFIIHAVKKQGTGAKKEYCNKGLGLFNGFSQRGYDCQELERMLLTA